MNKLTYAAVAAASVATGILPVGMAEAAPSPSATAFVDGTLRSVATFYAVTYPQQHQGALAVNYLGGPGEKVASSNCFEGGKLVVRRVTDAEGCVFPLSLAINQPTMEYAAKSEGKTDKGSLNTVAIARFAIARADAKLHQPTVLGGSANFAATVKGNAVAADMQNDCLAGAAVVHYMTDGQTKFLADNLSLRGDDGISKGAQRSRAFLFGIKYRGKSCNIGQMNRQK